MAIPKAEMVMATKMTLGEYLTLRGWPLQDEDPEERGYLVEHPDWGPPNTTYSDRFIQWVPERKFELDYASVPSIEQMS